MTNVDDYGQPNDHTTQATTATPLGEEELSALAGAANDLISEETLLVGKPLRWNWETGKWSFTVPIDGGYDLVFVGADAEFAVDLRSYMETKKRWWGGKPTHSFGGRLIDGWRNPPRHLLPDQDKTKWPWHKNKRTDPWRDAWQIVLRRCGDNQFFTWETKGYSDKRGFGNFLDVACKDAAKHGGDMPVVTLESWQRLKANGAQEWVPLLKITDWAPFPGASPPADRRNLERAKQKMQEICDELASAASRPPPVNGGYYDDDPGPGLEDQMRSEIPFALAFFITGAAVWLAAAGGGLIA